MNTWLTFTSALPTKLAQFPVGANSRSAGVLFQRAGGVSIFRGRVRSYNAEASRIDFALRVDATGWELVVQPVDQLQPVKLLGNGLALAELFSYDIPPGISKALTFTAEIILPVPIQTASRSVGMVQSEGATPPYSGTRDRLVALGRKDYLSGTLGQGIGRVQGLTVAYFNPTNKPYACRVRLIREADGMQVREVWSGEDGSYDFQWIDELQSYTVLAYYLEHGKRAVVADGLTLANGKVGLMA